MVTLVDHMTSWVQAEICNKIELKKKGEVADTGYDYTLVHPTAFPCYCPPDDKARQAAPTVPSATVQLDKRRSRLGEGTADFALIFAVWNPGEHDNSDPEAKKFTKTMDGWRDLFAFMDKAITALEKMKDAGGWIIEGEIVARPLHGDEALMGTYPFYYGEVTFTVKILGETMFAANELL